MNANLKIFLFILAVITFYTGLANSIPQIESRPPAETKLSANLSPQELAQVGKQIVTGDKGGCLVCHGIGSQGPRAPDLAGVGARAATRVAGMSAEEYLFNHILRPCQFGFVVPGYDCLMGGLGLDKRLTKAEQKAVVAFLESLGGQITVKLTPEDLAASTQTAGSGGPEFKGTTAQELIPQAGCPACHTIDPIGATGKVGPNLSSVGARLSADKIRQAILNPNEVLTTIDPTVTCPNGPCQPNDMPPNFGDRFTGKQLDTIVNFLASLGGPASGTPAGGQNPITTTAPPTPTP
jgi:mono/diheme cytochrome c family protein